MFMIALSNDNQWAVDKGVCQIIPTNFTCSVISGFRLKGLCLSVRCKKWFC